MTPEQQAMRRALADPFPPEVIGWKAQTAKGNRALAVGYIDARDVMNRLDDVVGPENWRTEFVQVGPNSVECRLSLRIGGEWVPKADVGSTSDQPDAGDKLKAAYSDALKRAAVSWGIGRYLYNLPAQWCDYDPQKKQLVGTPRLPFWALPKGVGTPPAGERAATQSAPQQPPPADPPKAATQFATVAALAAAMRSKADPPSAVSLADRVNWCDKELARLGASKPGAMVAAVCEKAGCANLQQLAGLKAADAVGAAWRIALAYVETFAHTKPADKPKAEAKPPATVGELWTLLGDAPPLKDGAGLVKRIEAVEKNLTRLVDDHQPGDLMGAVCEFVKVPADKLATAAGVNLEAAANRVRQFVKACETNRPEAR